MAERKIDQDRADEQPAAVPAAGTSKQSETIPGGKYINVAGHWVNANGDYIDANGKVVDEPVKART